MPDRENVLHALEHCDLCSDAPDCPGCTYLREPDCMEHLKRDIIALLKAQEPVSVQKKPMEMVGLQTWDWACGNCGQTVLFSAKFCPWCGRKVKWE